MSTERIAIFAHDHSAPEAIQEISDALSSAGYACVTSSYRDAVATAQPDHVDLWICDWPGDDPIADILIRTRQTDTWRPVLAVIERGQTDDALAALNAGADDYIVRPLRRTELVLRINALLGHAYPERKSVDEALQYGPFRFHTNKTLVTRDRMSVELTQKEFELALLFFRNLDRPLSRAFIQETVWSREPDIPSRTMDTHISRIRSKLGLRPENGFRLAPVYSYGYRLEQTP
ncbi:response regulator transcription factor [Noviherbaspirillum saxi]|uniref:DNA-binding response regulator n=1 Tax=Noviherbaspirillum saxi TaxID=2320863 RepID=A0A3A3FVI7_9BURK|nr:response regulator transcription factor [Noviherbaspirillum saxi]RJF99640.1 DNA-binding response regulator [Noviherbaspirillum saxi]